jgi:hypothetical protein
MQAKSDPKPENNNPGEQTQVAAQVVDMEGEELELVEVDAEEIEIPEGAELVLKHVAEGASLRKARELAGVGMEWWYDTVRAYPAVELRYARACAERATVLVEEANAIAESAQGMDNAGVQAAKLRVETRKWFASKLDPKRYGDYQRTEITQSEGGDVAGEAQRLLKLRKKALASKPTKPKA